MTQRRDLRIYAVVLAAFMALLMLAAQARAEGFGVAGFDSRVSANPGPDSYTPGDPYTQAGGHPYGVYTTIELNTITHLDYGEGWPAEPVKDVLVDLPVGLVGNPSAVETCTMAQLTADPFPTCPAASQVGTARLTVDGYVYGMFFGGPTKLPSDFFPQPIPVYNMVAPPGVPARFAMRVQNVIVPLDARVRSGSDFGLAIDTRGISAGLAISAIELTFWGVPGDDSHDAERVCAGQSSAGCPLDAPAKAFLTMPTSCTPGAGLPWNLRTDSWQHPGAYVTATDAGEDVTGCEAVPFTPSFTAQPATLASPGASGWVFDLSIPQNDEPDQLAQSHLRSAVVTLPEGVRVSPSSANGREACAPAQIALDSDGGASCPDASKIGAVRIDTPLLEQPLEGGIYLAKPHENPFGSLLAVYVVAEGPGVVIKLAGKLDADPIDGRLTATFSDTPQLPFSTLHLEFFGGSRAALTNPSRCGTYTTSATLASWSGKTVTSESSFTTSADGHGAACAAPGFTPNFSAGIVSPIAGGSSTFSLLVARDDADEELREIVVDMPEGLTARIADLAGLCPEAHAAAGTCDDASRIGRAITSAGPGSTPLALPGTVHMAGPYKGAPFSLSIAVPAVAGPFDLGTVVVRAAVHVDRKSSALRIVSAPLPTILEGIPLQIRSVNVLIEKEGFMVAPTDCSEKRIEGTIVSTAGTSAARSSRFQVGECAGLPFSPRMSLTVGGQGRTRAGGSTPLTASIRQAPGQANLAKVGVTLPATLNTRLDVVNDACTLAAFEAGACGDDAKAGTATAVTPLLRDPLKGFAYFVRSPARTLPDLMIALKGQVDIDLVGKVRIVGGKRLATSFDRVPDVPIRSFKLRLVAGENGPLGIAKGLCRASSRRATAKVTITAQSGKRIAVRKRLKVRGCSRR